jgi:excisionase family DNA binding protein
MENQKMMLTVAEVAQHLGVSRATVYAEIAKDRIRSILIAGRNRRISRESLNEYISRHETGQVQR